MSKVVKRIWNIVTTALVCVVVVVAILLVGVRLVGFDVYMVLSGSMEPVYKTGSIVYVKEVDPFKLEVGDDITFMLNEDTVATHRIIEVLPDPEDSAVIRFRTKGVNNDIADEQPVHFKNIIGQPVFTIPYLGYISNYVQNPPGMYVAIAGGAVLILMCFLPDLFSDDKEKEGKKKKAVAEGTEPTANAEEFPKEDKVEEAAEPAETDENITEG